jgi:hypothetical protein
LKARWAPAMVPMEPPAPLEQQVDRGNLRKHEIEIQV